MLIKFKTLKRIKVDNSSKTYKEHIPSVENRNELLRLSKEFKPTDVKFLLALNMDSSMEDCMETARGMTERLKKFIESGYSHDKSGLPKDKYSHRVVE